MSFRRPGKCRQTFRALGKHQSKTGVKCRSSANATANDGDLSRRVEHTKPKGMFLVRVAIWGKK